MRVLGRKWSSLSAITPAAICLLGLLSLRQLRAQSTETQYPRMAPIEQYLMDRNAEIELARSAATEAITHDATILVLGRHGYETAVEGKNGFVCMVERGLVGPSDWPDYWNPKIRGADCLNPLAARSILPIAKMRTAMALDGTSREKIIESISEALRERKFPALEPGAMGYMMAKGSYLTDQGGHNAPHLMFFVPLSDANTWGASLPGSPVGSGPYWFFSEEASQNHKDFPPLRIFTVRVGKWSDGTPAP